VRRRIGRRALAFPARIDRRRVGDKPFCVISDDCWAGELYKHLVRAYNTPFVGVSMRAPDYLRLLSDLPGNLGKELSFEEEGKSPEGTPYPIGYLGQVAIHFIHYPEEAEAREKFERRRQRVDFDNLFFKLSAGRPHCTPELLEEFYALPFERKLALTRDHSGVQVPDWSDDGNEMFYRSQRVFDAVGWVAGEPVEHVGRPGCFA
jgi:uncharacterized protein (DUF1919 family)